MTKFKVGDKVRILDVNKIVGGNSHWNNGDVVKVTKTGYKVWLERTKTSETLFQPFLHDDEHRYIELVSDKPTKNQRITTLEQNVVSLESEVAELKAKVEALEKTQKPMRVSEVVDVYYRGEYVGKFPAQSITQNITVKSDADIPNIALQLAKLIEGETDKRRKKMSLTPNEQRKAIIAEAKAFVAKHTTPNTSSFEWNERGAIKWEGYGVIPEFHVNKEKRIVTLILKGAGTLDGRVKAKFFAKCAPDDVFNADIGKAIALGRALGLDVSRFEQAVKPTELVVGMTAKFRGNFGPYVQKAVEGDSSKFHDVSRGNSRLIAIIDDTEAVY